MLNILLDQIHRVPLHCLQSTKNHSLLTIGTISQCTIRFCTLRAVSQIGFEDVNPPLLKFDRLLGFLRVVNKETYNKVVMADPAGSVQLYEGHQNQILTRRNSHFYRTTS